MDGQLSLTDEQLGSRQAASHVSGISGMRWYCLVICSGVAAMQGAYWNNFGPISVAVKPFFGWHDSDIALLANWGPIMFLVFAVPYTWLMDVKGVKWSCVVSAALLFGGSVCRIVHVSGDRAGSYWMHAGQILNGIPGPVAMGIGPVLAATWFPPNERTTATAVCAVLNYGGNAAVFVLGPLVVKEGVDVGRHLWQYMFGQCLLALLLLIGAVCMPLKPSAPPSASAQVPRTMMWTGFRSLSRLPAFWPVAVSYGVMSGFLGAWGSQLGPIMGSVLPLDVAQDDAGWMGFWGALAGMGMGVTFGLAADSARMAGRKKPLILLASTLASISFLVFACFCSGLLGNNGIDSAVVDGLFATSILAALFCNASVPLFLEMAVEAAYPIAEGLTTNALTVVSNIASLIFLGVQSWQGIGTQWMNWACAAGCFLPVVLMIRLREQRHRLVFDQGCREESPDKAMLTRA